MKFETVWNHFVRDVFGSLTSKHFAAIATWRLLLSSTSFVRVQQDTPEYVLRYYGLRVKNIDFLFVVIVVI